MSPSVRLVASILALTALGGCSFHMGGGARPSPQGEYIAERDLPPPPEPEVIPAPPSRDHVWVKGHYERRGRGYAWERGHYEHRPVSRASWVPAHWEVQGRSKTWVDGHWG